MFFFMTILHSTLLKVLQNSIIDGAIVHVLWTSSTVLAGLQHTVYGMWIETDTLQTEHSISFETRYCLDKMTVNDVDK